ncbi:hypothetical protein K493DRAFT_315779 [Basidiobolus meristosporus CBS 931.73]|uniref:Uncharacterized protein n=1 Tax=Basidiobolus meristosporus CBS 931.73 TaxID=1314790 RepID=A0A1Y1Y748_9FUNG|nr:hypothetical protein K493DRAFT_315779 [Basidiobolus meristosporus CBS 931.73]|eukprot:ORX93840.1 hypothetical protein K493DRAFT_315779 [Basidiobolus meristosporus CBS 931.73]
MANSKQEELQVELRKLVDSTIEVSHNLFFDYDKVVNGEDSENTARYTSPDTLEALGKLLSHDATKLSLACKPPVDDAAPGIKVCQSLAENTAKLVAHASQPILETSTGKEVSFEGLGGKTLASEVQAVVQKILSSVASLANSFLDSPVQLEAEASQHGFLVSSGKLWESCDMIPKLSHNNRDAVKKRWKELEELLLDVANEFSEMISNTDDDEEGEDEGEEFDDGWGEILGDVKFSKSEKQIAQNFHSLLAPTRLLYRKVLKRGIEECPLKTQEQVNWLDTVLDVGKATLEQADEIGSALWEHQPEQSIISRISDFNGKISELINVATMYVESEEHTQWYAKLSEKYAKTFETVLNSNSPR